MNDERWKNLRGMILDKFTVEIEEKEEIEDIPNGYIEYLVFDGPLGRLKVERKVTPVVIDKKTIYSARAGVAKNVEYIYSDNEFSNKLRVYKWVNEDWEEIDANAFG